MKPWLFIFLIFSFISYLCIDSCFISLPSLVIGTAIVVQYLYLPSYVIGTAMIYYLCLSSLVIGTTLYLLLMFSLISYCYSHGCLFPYVFRAYTHFERVILKQRFFYSLVYTISIGRCVN